MSDDRKRSFDATAELYDRVRPSYPDALFDDLEALSGVPHGGAIMEVGCGTGQATLPLARRGYRILAVDLGAAMVAIARRKLARFPHVQVEQGMFEQYSFEPAPFDLLVSATAWHWVDPTVRYRRAPQVLRDGGAIAIFWNEHVKIDEDNDVFAAMQPLYRRYAPELAANFRYLRPEQIEPGLRDDIDREMFGPVEIRRYAWQTRYDARSYIDLLSTFSNYLALDADARARLLEGIATLIDTHYNGSITKGYLATLYVARKIANDHE